MNHDATATLHRVYRWGSPPDVPRIASFSRLLRAALCAALLACGPGRGQSAARQETSFESQGDDSPDRQALALRMESELIESIEHASKAFVFIGGGSGVCITPDGYILTNYHVAGQRRQWIVRLGVTDRLYRAHVVGCDPVGDVTLLKIPEAEGLPFVRFAERARLKVGQHVLALGDPFKLGDIDGAPGVSLGTLSALHRYQSLLDQPLARGLYMDALQTDAAVNPGNSGGPLLDLEGRLLGITGQIMARFDPKTNSGIAYAIPCDQLVRFLPLLKNARGGNVFHGSLPEGLHLDFTAPEPAPNTPGAGALIRALTVNSPAEKAGFRTGDVIASFQGQPVHGATRLLSMVQSWPERTEAEFMIKRDARLLSVKAALTRLRLPKTMAP